MCLRQPQIDLCIIRVDALGALQVCQGLAVLTAIAGVTRFRQ
jgi:hypothetical protein